MGEETCLNVKKPTEPPAGHSNGEWYCTTTGWQWRDDIGIEQSVNNDETDA